MKTLLVTLLLLVIGTGTASAECAWVLWLEQTILSKAEKEWTPLSAASSHPDCQRALAAAIDLQSKPRTGTTIERVGPNAIRTRTGDLRLDQFLRYVCFPDTIDPRGPKGEMKP